MSRRLNLILGLLLFSVNAFAQTAAPNYYITFSTNLYLPGADAEKSTFPIVGYSKNTSPKLLLGGFGVGIAAFKPVSNNISLKGQASLFRQSYWNGAITVTDENRNPVADVISNSVDYAVGLHALAQYTLSERFSVGAGLGGQLLLASLTRLPEVQYSGAANEPSSFALNRYYKPFMPVIPVEVTYHQSKWLLAMRYEQALLNRLKGDLQDVKTDKFGLLNFEIGIKIK